ncbi:MAG: PH domain-containing protein [Acidimicrobiia bacterium]|nr:PH domain-containing protein [Acidimicrobiia bacterium]
MGWPEDALSNDEEIISSFRPHWKLLFIPALWFIGLSVLIVLLGVYLDWVGWVINLALLGLMIWLVVRPLIDWYWTRYVLTTERLITRSGLIAKQGVEIPLENITNVNFSQTVIERVLGAGDLLIESAGTTGQSEFENIPHPDEFQALLYKVRERRSMELSGKTPPPPQDPAEAIRSLAKLHEDGLITDEEYERKRRELLDDM